MSPLNFLFFLNVCVSLWDSLRVLLCLTGLVGSCGADHLYPARILINSTTSCFQCGSLKPVFHRNARPFFTFHIQCRAVLCSCRGSLTFPIQAPYNCLRFIQFYRHQPIKNTNGAFHFGWEVASSEWKCQLEMSAAPQPQPYELGRLHPSSIELKAVVIHGILALVFYLSH